ncbi:site-specific integrase [Methylobacterium sp. Leaf118]|uniref:site-specific integrase n=1 Tax=Methylobacterium sp. Leaf118 TaxID=2876562 RepID=UPI003FA5E252
MAPARICAGSMGSRGQAWETTCGLISCGEPVRHGHHPPAAPHGARKSELLQLKWTHVDREHGYLRLPASKTGAKAIPVGAAALALIDAQPRLDQNPHVFVGGVAGYHFVELSKVWERIRTRAGLPDVRLHDLRHSFASVGASSGSSLPLLGAILGHRDPNTTQRYAHIARDPARAAADHVSDLVSAFLAPRSGD